MTKKYRYITNGVTLGAHKVSGFRLIGGNNIKPDYIGKVAIRVNIPVDLQLTKYSCDPYSTTEDERTIDELGYDILIWNGRRWETHNEFKGTRPCDINLSVRLKRINTRGRGRQTD